VPSISELSEFYKPVSKAQQANHRLMLVVAMDEDLGVTVARQLAHIDTSCLWVDVLPELHSMSHSLAPGHQFIHGTQTNQHLGTSNQYVVYCAHRGFNASALCALSGTIVGGGVLILLVPVLAQWPANFDSQLQSFGQNAAKPYSYFVKWWMQQFSHPAVYTLQDPMFVCHQVKPHTSLPLFFDIRPSLSQPTKDQHAIIRRLSGAYHHQERRVFNLSAHRGRGKSACLGWLIKALGTVQLGPVLVTAPSKRALRTLVQTAKPTLVKFYALDALLTQLPKAAMLIIDEAAAIPLSQLAKLMAHYGLVVLSSTQDGYEGSGQGYRLKLPRVIEALGLDCEMLKLTQPMRWQAKDPLEHFIRSSFLCDVNIDVSTQVPTVDIGLPLSYTQMSGATLALNTDLLKQVYALLMLAHYQTTPQDLRLLLDHPQHQIMLCYQGSNLVALAWVSTEGGLNADLAQHIALGKRRIQGHLLAQILTQQAGFPEACVLLSWRIQRLVVLPSLQGNGFGSALLNHLYETAQEAKVDFVGASFAANSGTLAFWLSNQYQVAWLGLRADAATGLNSVQVIRSISPSAHRLSGQLNHHLSGYLLFGKAFWFQCVSKNTLQAIKANCAMNTAPALDHEQKQRLLKLLAMGQAGFSGPLHIMYQQLRTEAHKRQVMHAAQNNSNKALQQGVRQLALSLLESPSDQ